MRPGPESRPAESPPKGRRRHVDTISSRRLAGVLLLILASGLALPAVNEAQDDARERAASSLKRLSLEELAEIEVTSMGRRGERLSRTAAAIYVITAEEIRRSGARSLPEVLRLATGLHVARVNNGSWAISARGLNSSVANKLQVMIDGRVLYSPLFSGVFWDAQDVLLEDIERIEVVRGPGATMWGSNAFNGVINVITKGAQDTQGGYVEAGGGAEERAFTSARWGGPAGQHGHYRVYGKYFGRDSMRTVSGLDARNFFHFGQTGFRSDWALSDRDTLTAQGDFYRANMQRHDRDDNVLRGGNLLARWTRRNGNASELQVQAYYDRTSRFLPQTFDEVRNTYDLEVQHRFIPAERHELIWGAGYRGSADRTQPFPAIFFVPAGRTLHLFSFFVQDEIVLAPDRLAVVAGSKFERNTYTGWEVQPTFRLGWTPDARQLVWGAVSRAVRIPTRLDRELFATDGTVVTTRGDERFRSEEVIAYEVGYRVQPHARVSFDLATFYNDYDSLRSLERPAGTGPTILLNKLEGRTYGAELSVAFQAAPWWRLRTSYTHLQEALRFEPDSTDVTGGQSEANDPRNQFSARSYMDLGRNVELDFTIRHVSALRVGPIPGYTVFDARLGWRPRPELAFSIVGQNLPDRAHREFGTGLRPEAVERGVYGKVEWFF